jgi:hypothetical protein
MTVTTTTKTAAASGRCHRCRWVIIRCRPGPSRGMQQQAYDMRGLVIGGGGGGEGGRTAHPQL